MLSMSSFPSTAAVYILEDSSIVIQNYVMFFSFKIFLEPAPQEYLQIQFCLQLVAGTFTRLFFVPASLLSFDCLPESASSLLTSLFGSSLRQEPNLLSRCIQHLDPCL